jgi:hypothetical protein
MSRVARASGLAAAAGALAVAGVVAHARCGQPPGRAGYLTMPDGATHTGFPIGAGPHAVDCAQCHGTFESFRQFDCTGCHTEAATAPAHTGVAAFAFRSTSCLSCHPDGQAPSSGVDHDRNFPIGAGSKHESVGCSDCHGATRAPSDLKCTACHTEAPMATAHTMAGGYQWSAPVCLSCHADAQVERVAAHTPFALTSGAAHANASCAVCHPGKRADKPLAIDFNTNDCLSCHASSDTTPKHAGVPGFQYATASCLTCHPSGGPAQVDHAANFPIAAGSVHAALRCGDCHIDASNQSNVSCTTCHDHDQATMSSPHGSVGGYQWQPSSCLLCHAEATIERIAAHAPFTVSSGSNHFQQPCLDCHTARRTDKPWAADFTVESCSACHAKSEMDDKHSDVSGYAYSVAACLRCHPNGTKP